MQQRCFAGLTFVALAFVCAAVCPAATPPLRPEGTLTVAVATFGNERWLPHLYVGAEDVGLKPLLENLLHRDLKSGDLTPLLAEHWEVLDGGRTRKFRLRKGVPFHGGWGEVTAEDVKFTFTGNGR